MIPVYVINLDRRPDRWAGIAGQLDRLGIEPIRVPALDGVHATSKDFEPFVRLDGWTRRKQLDLASAACIVSHRNALDRFLRETDAPAALILEDDVKLASDLPDFLMSVELALRSTGLVKLDAVADGSKQRRRPLGSPIGTVAGRKLHPIGSKIPGGGAYVVARGTAETIVRNCYDVTDDYDIILFDMRISRLARQLRPVLVQPALVNHQAKLFTSDIDRWRKSAPPTSLVRQLVVMLRKVPRQMFTVWQLATGRMKRTRPTFADRV